MLTRFITLTEVLQDGSIIIAQVGYVPFNIYFRWTFNKRKKLGFQSLRDLIRNVTQFLKTWS